MLQQVKRLISIREQYSRILRDDELINRHPSKISHRIHKIGVKLLRERTVGLQGDEKIQKMKELAAEVYETLTEAIDEVEKDITYNPREYLGFALYPDNIWQVASLLGTTAIALA